MEKINIAELLKDCPGGMELDCVMYDNVSFIEVINDKCGYPIRIQTRSGYTTGLTKYGQNINNDDAKCVIFPKGKTTWEGFQKPFKDGDVVVSRAGNIAIFSNLGEDDAVVYHCCYMGKRLGLLEKKGYGIGGFNDCRLATEEEKQKLFDAIKANGYKWDAETKTLEKLPKFKVGDKITNDTISITIGYIDDNYYYEIGKNTTTRISIKNQDDWELIPNKFDITTLEPFDKVLVRYSNNVWHIQFFEKYDKRLKYPFVCMNNSNYKQCIPYENNKHLFNTTNDCDDFYKTWE